MSSGRENHFDLLLRVFGEGLPEPQREVQAIPGRRFRYDFAWVEQKVAVEVQGGTWIKGGHSTGSGIRRDCEKNNLSILHGWRVLHFTSDMLDNDGEGCIQLVREVLSALKRDK